MDINEKKYGLISPDGKLLKQISESEINNLDIQAWTSYCPGCGCLIGYYTTEEEAKDMGYYCYECRMYPPKVDKCKGYYLENIRCKLFISSYRVHDGIIFPHFEVKE